MTYTPEKATGVSEMKVTLPAYCMLALTLIGIADVAYVAYGNFTAWRPNSWMPHTLMASIPSEHCH